MMKSVVLLFLTFIQLPTEEVNILVVTTPNMAVCKAAADIFQTSPVIMMEEQRLYLHSAKCENHVIGKRS